jgi:hypothetical protein
MTCNPRVQRLAELLEALDEWLAPEMAPSGGSTILPARETRDLAAAVRHARYQLRGTLIAAGLDPGPPPPPPPPPPRTVADLLREHGQLKGRMTAAPCRRLG